MAGNNEMQGKELISCKSLFISCKILKYEESDGGIKDHITFVMHTVVSGLIKTVYTNTYGNVRS